MILIVGGNINSTLKTWLMELNIENFNQIDISICDISPNGLKEAAEQLKIFLTDTDIIISVGPLADKLLNSLYTLHGTLPSTQTKDKKEIEKALIQCKNYLLSRRHYVNQQPKPTIS